MVVAMIMSMLVIVLRMIDVSRLFPVHQDVNFRRRNSAAIDAAYSKLSPNIQRSHGTLQ
jgi:hypothetical protein